MKSAFLPNEGLLCLYDKQNNTWLLVDMKFLFSCSTRHLTRSLRSLVSYRVKHSKRNSISTRTHVLFSNYYALEMYLYSLSSVPHDYICAFLIAWKSYQLQFPSYSNNRFTSFVMKSKPFPELTDILLREQCETPGSWYWHKHKLQGPCIPLKSIHEPSISPCPQETKRTKVAMSLW